MIFKVKQLAHEEYAEWDRFVDDSPQGDVFCYSWWLDTVAVSGFKIIALRANEMLVAGIPLVYDEFGRINEPPLTRSLGILFISNNKAHNFSDKRRWVCSLVEHLPVNKIAQFCTHHNFTDWLPFKWAGLSQTTRYTYILDYSGKDETELWKGLNRGKKSIINKAKNNGIRIVQSNDPTDAYTFLEKSYKRQGLKVHFSIELLIRMDTIIKKNLNRIILNSVGKDGSVHASIYVVWNKKSAYYLFSGSDPAKRHLGGHTLVLWETLKFLRDKTTYFNFCGSDIKNIEQHVRGFGGTLTPYFHIYNAKVLHSTDFHYHLDNLIYHFEGLIMSISTRLFRKKS